MSEQNARDQEHAPDMEEDQPMERDDNVSDGTMFPETSESNDSESEVSYSENFSTPPAERWMMENMESYLFRSKSEALESGEPSSKKRLRSRSCGPVLQTIHVRSDDSRESNVPVIRKTNSPEPEYRKWSYFKCKEELVQAARDSTNKFLLWKKLPSLPQRNIIKIMNFLEQESMGQLSRKTRKLVTGKYHFKKIEFDTLDKDWNKIPNESSGPLPDEQRFYFYPDVKVITEDAIGTNKTFLWDFLDSYKKSNYTFDRIELTEDVALEALIDYFKGYKPFKAGELVLSMDDMLLRCEGWLNKLIDKNAVHTLTIPHALSRDLYSSLRVYKFWNTAKNLNVENCFGNTGDAAVMQENVDLQQEVEYDRDVDFEDLSHFENLKFYVETITANDAWEFIKGYRGHNHTSGSQFFIGCPGKIDCEQLLRLFDVPAKNQPIPSFPAAQHTQIFAQSDHSLILVVIIDRDYFRGYVWKCCKTNKDFKAVKLLV